MRETRIQRYRENELIINGYTNTAKSVSYAPRKICDPVKKSVCPRTRLKLVLEKSKIF